MSKFVWGIERSEQGFHITDDSNFSDVALVYEREHSMLLAAAPALLEALQDMVYWFGQYPEMIPTVESFDKYKLAIDKSCEAIKKATEE